MANGHGGARPGAGRRTKADRHEGPILRVEALIAGHLEQAVANLIALADGGDLKANQYLIDRILGRPKQAVELAGEDGGPVEVVHFYLPANGRERERPDADRPA